MKLKLLNKSNKFRYSCLGRNVENIYNNNGFGLDLSFSIYKTKLEKEDCSFSQFLHDFFSSNPDIRLPHYLPQRIESYKQSKNFPLGINSNEKKYFENLSTSIIENKNIMTIIIGSSGSGKTTTFLGFSEQCRLQNKNINTFSGNNYFPCYLSINNENKKNISRILKESTLSIINEDKIDEYLKYSFPILFFVDVQAKTLNFWNKNNEVVFQNKVKESELSEILLNIKDKLYNSNTSYGTKHKMVILHRCNFSIPEENTDDFYNEIKEHCISWKMGSLDISDVVKYIDSVSGTKSRKILKSILTSSSDILTTPIFIDFLNWILINSNQNSNLEDIKSLGQLYLAFSRVFFRLEYKKWESKGIFKWIKKDKQRDRIFSFDDESRYSKAYSKAKNFVLEEEPHPIDLILQLISNLEVENIFLDSELDKFLQKIIKEKTKYPWLNNYRDTENELPYDKRLNSECLKKYTLLKEIGDGQLEFFHNSMEMFYLAKSIFYDLDSGIIMSPENIKYYQDKINKNNYEQTLIYFIGLLESFVENREEFLSKMNLSMKTRLNLGRAFYTNSMFDEAIIEFEKLLSEGLYQSECNLFLGRIYLELNNFEKSKIYFLKLLELDPESLSTLLHLGIIYLTQLEKAIFYFEQYINLAPDSDVGYAYLGMAYFSNCNFDKGNKAWDRALQINPSSTLVKNFSDLKDGVDFDLNKNNLFEAYLGNLDIVQKYLKLLKNGNISELEKECKDFLELFPNDISSLLFLASALKEKGNLSEAEVYYKKVLSIFPSYSNALMELGKIYQEQKEYHKALDFYKKALEISPNNELLYVYLGKLYQDQKEYHKALEFYQNGIEINPGNDLLYMYLGDLYQDQKEYNKALEFHKKALEINPNDELLYVHLGKLYQDQKEYDNALEFYQKAIEINPNNGLLYVYLGKLYQDQKEYDNALEFHKKAIEINTDDYSAYYNLGFTYSELKEYHKAIEMYQKSIELNPDNDYLAYTYLGLNYLKLKKYDKTLEFYQKALEINPNNEILYILLGKLYKEQKEYEKSIEYYNEALKIDPNSLDILTLLKEAYLKTEKFQEVEKISLKISNLK